MRRLCLLLCCCFPLLLSAQFVDEQGEYGVYWGGYFFGFKGGASLGNQDWSGIETELNLGYHAAGFLETIPAQGQFSFWAQLGYHVRGSRISRRRAFDVSGNQFRLPADNFEFNNVSLALGGKQVVKYTRLADIYYLLGLRADYNLSTNLGEYNQLSTSQGVAFRSFYPFDSYDFINRFTYGASVGAGGAFPISNAIGGFIEISAHPDFNFQYTQPAINNVISPYGGTNITLGERAIRNFTIEISFGLRFLRKWTYLNK